MHAGHTVTWIFDIGNNLFTADQMYYMKKLLLFITILTCSFAGYAQEVLRVQNGAVLTVQNGAAMVVQGDVNLENGSTLSNNGTITITRNGAGGTGNWFDNAVTGYNYGTGTFIFNSTGNQTINSKGIFERIEVNSGGVDLASDINTNKWYLVNGKVNTGAFRAIALSTSALAIEPDPTNPNFGNGWINGNIRRYISPASVNNYRFPTGNSTQSNPVEMDNLTANALNNVTYMDAFFAPKAGSDAGLVVTESGTLYMSIHNGGVWHLVPNATPTAGRYNLKAYFNGFAGLSDNQFSILRRPEGSVNGADWAVPAGSSLYPNGGLGRKVSDGYAQRNNLSTFSEFGLGLTNAPLPVTLVAFDANRFNKTRVKLTWETASEQNNKGFEVERRLDNETSFSVKGFVASLAPAGNSATPLDYIYNDANGYGGISYYRLKQTDLDGRSHYSLIKAVRGEGTTEVSVMIWPNPNAGQFSIRIDGANSAKEAQILDMNGKLVQKMLIQNQKQVNINHLSVGTYILSIPNAFGEGQHFSEKVMVVR
jgi:hypothetical protein